MKAKYIRVSTTEQNISRQIDENVKMYIDKISGKVPFKDRPSGIELLNDIKKGIINEVEFHAVERIGRNASDSLTIIDILEKKKVQVYIKNLGISLFLENGKKNPMFGIAIAVLSSLAQTEKENMEERQREGIEIAKIKGVYKGRKAGAVQTNEQLLERHNDIVKHLNIGKNSLREIALLTGKSVNTIQKVKQILTPKAHV